MTEKYINNLLVISEFHSSFLNKHIYVLGESHSNISCKYDSNSKQKTQTDIAEFFTEIIDNNKDKLIDFFIEIPYKSKNKKDFYKTNKVKSEDSGTHELHYEFWDCLNLDKKNCPYSNVRMHYSNIRSGDTRFHNVSIFYRFIRKLAFLEGIRSYLQIPDFHGDLNMSVSVLNIFGDSDTENPMIEILSKDVLRKLQKFSGSNIETLIESMKEKNRSLISLFFNDSEPYLDVIKEIKEIKQMNSGERYKYLTDNAKIEKQIDKIDSNLTMIKSTLKEHYDKYFASVLKIIDIVDIDYLEKVIKGEIKYQEFIEETPPNFWKKLKEYLHGNRGYLYLADIMDVYITARIFRQFSNAPSPENIIIYLGDGHVKFYQNILKTFGFTEKTKQKLWNLCLDISSFIPFFNKENAEMYEIEYVCESIRNQYDTSMDSMVVYVWINLFMSLSENSRNEFLSVFNGILESRGLLKNLSNNANKKLRLMIQIIKKFLTFTDDKSRIPCRLPNSEFIKDGKIIN